MIRSSSQKSAKISVLDELTNILINKNKTDVGVVQFSNQFKIGRFLSVFSSIKKRGLPVISVLLAMIFSRLGGVSIYAKQQTGDLQMDDNTMYRLMNNPLIDWKSMLLSFTKEFLRCVASKGEKDNENNKISQSKCFILDDTTIEKAGKTFEGLSKVHDHVSCSFVFGFKLLVLCYWDGKSLLPFGFSLHRESKKKEYGLNKKQQKRQFKKERDVAGFSQQYIEELDEEKCKVAIRQIKRAVRNRILANYVLMDSWFISDFMIKSIREIKNGLLNVVGMCKMDKRKFEINEKLFNSHTIIKINEAKGKVQTSRKYKSKYISVVASYDKTAVKLFYIKYKGAKNWTLLLTTDLSLSFVKTMELYQIRWSIEVMFKECKQYLRLGKSQNTDLCGQIADVALTFITYTILTLYKRFENYETLGKLFRETQKFMLEKTLCERIALVVLKIITDLLEILCIDVEETIYRIIALETNNKSIQILLNAVYQLNNEHSK